ncbi:MAG: outer membrane protein transport protein [Burkholderiales bacterium]
MRKILISAGIAAALAPGVALATDGYFSHGYGMKSIGMGGVGIALPQDALAPATNPAGLTMVGNRLDIGLDWFRPTRGADIVNNGAGMTGSYNGNDATDFLIPEFGYSRMLNPDMAVGIAVYGNGGMNTKYKSSPFAAVGGTSPTGVDLTQLFVAPTVAYKVNPNNSIGLSLNLAYQQFGLSGLQTSAFAGFSSDPMHFSDQGKDSSTGWGARIGWTGQVSSTVTLGATYQSKTKMGKFDKYKGLFANQGEFDIPENYGIGIAVKATPRLTVAADVEQINYSKVAAVGDPIDSLFAGKLFGSTDGPGFGWRDVTTLKLGASYEYRSDLVLRAGFQTLRQPIPENQTLFNILAPGVVEQHVTLGATWTLANNNELTLGYMHAFKKEVNGVNSIPLSFGGGEANLHMYEDSIGIAYGIKM